MELKISELKPNPYKKHINKGKLNNQRINVLKESVEHGTLPEFFIARKKGNVFELTSGHHRVEAIKQVKGSDYLVNVEIVDFTDEQMLIDMVRENLAQRSDDFREERDSIVFVEQYLKGKMSGVTPHDTSLNKRGQLRDDKTYQGIGCRQIAEFISKNGKMISRNKVNSIKKIIDKIHPDIQEEIIHSINQHDTDENYISKSIATELSIIENQEEQKILAEIIKEKGKGHKYWREVLPIYKNAPDEIKQQVLSGEIDIADVEFESDKQELIEKANKRPITVFIPDLNQRMKELNYNISKLENHVNIFSKVFRSNEFKEKYYDLKPKQKQKLNSLVFNIKDRIKECYDEIEYFIEILGENKEQLEEK